MRIVWASALVVTMFLLAFVTGEQIGMQKGKDQALKEALRTNPPSDELEMTCLGLWLGEQNKKYAEKYK